jgi:hypothetical protein
MNHLVPQLSGRNRGPLLPRCWSAWAVAWAPGSAIGVIELMHPREDQLTAAVKAAPERFD